jgi:hypothetical protein
MGYDAQSFVSDASADPAAREIIDGHLPGALDSPLLERLPFLPLGAIARGALFTGDEAPDLDPMWTALAELPTSPKTDRPRLKPAPASDYDGLLERPGKLLEVAGGEQWGVAEIVLRGPSHGNPFLDVDLSASLVHDDGTVASAGGFYDGDGLYRIRFQPPLPGRWRFTIASTTSALNDIAGSFTTSAPAPGNHGPVRVADTFHFAHADGTRFLPFGTTAYAWTHQTEELEEKTLETLAPAPFTKVRMCVFPKSYLYNANEPPREAYERGEDGDWDYSRFNPDFFRHLEERILDLQALGIEADLIFFHAYDRWGYSRMPGWADDLYVAYLARRLGAIRSVWWSLANEYDLLPQKSVDDWERLAEIVTRESASPHLTSIHNCGGFYDYSRPWITHCSIQRIDVYRTAEFTDEWREQFGKPIVIDECAYEGDIDQGWGNISGEELIRRSWEGAVRGGYVNHGETYYNSREELWWSKGGELIGDSPERYRFLTHIISEAPGGILDPRPSEWDARWAGTTSHRLVYFGFGRPRFRSVSLPADSDWRVDVIDTWNMTVDALPDTYRGRCTIPLPGRPFMALRFRRE